MLQRESKIRVKLTQARYQYQYQPIRSKQSVIILSWALYTLTLIFDSLCIYIDDGTDDDYNDDAFDVIDTDDDINDSIVKDAIYDTKDVIDIDDDIDDGVNTDDDTQDTTGCMAFNWIEEFQSCFLLSGYNRMKSRDGVTAGLCESVSCEAEMSEENVIFKSNGDTIISREEFETFDDCYAACEEVREGFKNISSVTLWTFPLRFDPTHPPRP